MKYINSNLLNQANYRKESSIKYLFKQYHWLRELSYSGDSVAMSILMDLDACLEHEYLTDKQRKALYYYYIQQYTFHEVAEKLELKFHSSAQNRVNSGVSRVKDLLTGEEKLY